MTALTFIIKATVLLGYFVFLIRFVWRKEDELHEYMQQLEPEFAEMNFRKHPRFYIKKVKEYHHHYQEYKKRMKNDEKKLFLLMVLGLVIFIICFNI